MSVEMPPELAWVARLAVGQAWPKGNEDDLHALGQAWHEAAQELRGISGQLGASGNGVLESVGGQVADEFSSFVTQLEANLPAMTDSANQLGKLGRYTAVQVEYSKFMILGQLVLLAAQIAEWIFFAPELIPVAITAARVAVRMILRRLILSIAIGVGFNAGLDVAVQTIQFLRGDRTEWSADNSVSAVVSGAIGGAVGGLFFGVGGVLAPRFANSLLGKGVLGAATGVGTAGIMYGMYHSGQDEFGTSISAGALGALGGGGRRRFGGKDGTFKVDPVQVNLPGALKFDLPGLLTAVRTGLSGPSTLKWTTGDATAVGTNRNGHRSGSASGNGNGEGAVRGSASASAPVSTPGPVSAPGPVSTPGPASIPGPASASVSGSAVVPVSPPGASAGASASTGAGARAGTGVAGGGGVSRTGDTVAAREAARDTSGTGTARHGRGLPGFSTTVTGTTVTSTTTSSAPATTATAAPRVTTVGGSTGENVSRPLSTGGSGTGTPGTGRPATVSTGVDATAAPPGAGGAQGVRSATAGSAPRPLDPAADLLHTVRNQLKRIRADLTADPRTVEEVHRRLLREQSVLPGMSSVQLAGRIADDIASDGRVEPARVRGGMWPAHPRAQTEPDARDQARGSSRQTAPAIGTSAAGDLAALGGRRAIGAFSRAPERFLRDNVLLLRMDEGMRVRMPDSGISRTRFLNWMDGKDKHWFTLTVDADRSPGAGRPVYLLTPAVEKYVEAFGRDDAVLREIVRGHDIPAVRGPDEYVPAHYVPYFQGSTTHAQTNVGHTDVPVRKDPEFDADFVFTATMSGCALVLTESDRDGAFTVWHYQSPSGTVNAGAAVGFRGERQPFEWFGHEQYMTRRADRAPEVTNLLWRGPNGWEILSQENHASFTTREVTWHDFRSKQVFAGRGWNDTAIIYRAIGHERLADIDKARADAGQMKKDKGNLNLIGAYDLVRMQAEAEVRDLDGISGPDQLLSVARSLRAAHQDTGTLVQQLLAKQAQLEREESPAVRRRNDETGVARLRGRVLHAITEFSRGEWRERLEREAATAQRTVTEPAGQASPLDLALTPAPVRLLTTGDPGSPDGHWPNPDIRTTFSLGDGGSGLRAAHGDEPGQVVPRSPAETFAPLNPWSAKGKGRAADADGDPSAVVAGVHPAHRRQVLDLVQVWDHYAPNLDPDSPLNARLRADVSAVAKALADRGFDAARSVARELGRLRGVQPWAGPLGAGRTGPDGVRAAEDAVDSPGASTSALPGTGAGTGARDPYSGEYAGDTAHTVIEMDVVRSGPAPNDSPFLVPEALGDLVVTVVPRFSGEGAAAWAHRIMQTTELPTDRRPGRPDDGAADAADRAIRHDVERQLVDFLASPPRPADAPATGREERERQRAEEVLDWEEKLQSGRVFVSRGRLVWLQPVLREVRHLSEGGADRHSVVDEAVEDDNGGAEGYRVAFGSTTGKGVSASGRKWEGAAQVINVISHRLSHLAASVISAPLVSATGETATEHGWTKLNIAGSKPFVRERGVRRADLAFRIFVDGREANYLADPGPRAPRTSAAVPPPLTPRELAAMEGADQPGTVVPRRLTVGYPQRFLGDDALQPFPAREAREARDARDAREAGRADADGDGPEPPRSHIPVLLNAVNVVDAVADLHGALRRAGIGAQTAVEVLKAIKEQITERGLRNRSRLMFGGGDVSGPIVVRDATTGARTFSGHLRFQVAPVPGSVAVKGVTPGLSTRTDIGSGLTLTHNKRFESTVALSASYNASGLRAGGPGHEAAGTAPAHPVNIVTGTLPMLSGGVEAKRGGASGLGTQTMNHTVLNAADDQVRATARMRLTVEVVTDVGPPVPAVGTVVRAEVGAPHRDGRGARFLEHEWAAVPAPVAAARPPAWVTAQRARHPAPATRPAHGFDMEWYADGGADTRFTVATAMPGAHLVLRTFRAILERKLPGLTFSERFRVPVSRTAVENELASFFGRHALEADIAEARHGVVHTIRLADRAFRLTATLHAGDTPFDVVAYESTVNQRQMTMTQSSSGVKDSNGFDVGLGAGFRVDLNSTEGHTEFRGDGGRIQFALAPEYGRDRGTSDTFQTAASSYRRAEVTRTVREGAFAAAWHLSVDELGAQHPPEEVWLSGRGMSVQVIDGPATQAPPPPESKAVGLARERGLVRPLRLGAGGADGMYAQFTQFPHLTRAVSELYARLHGVAPHDMPPAEVPEALVRELSPRALATHFQEIASGHGRFVGLPGRGGYHQVMHVALVFLERVADRRVAADPTEFEQYQSSRSTHTRTVVAGGKVSGGASLAGQYRREFVEGGTASEGAATPQSPAGGAAGTGAHPGTGSTPAAATGAEHLARSWAHDTSDDDPVVPGAFPADRDPGAPALARRGPSVVNPGSQEEHASTRENEVLRAGATVGGGLSSSRGTKNVDAVGDIHITRVTFTDSVKGADGETADVFPTVMSGDVGIMVSLQRWRDGNGRSGPVPGGAHHDTTVESRSLSVTYADAGTLLVPDRIRERMDDDLAQHLAADVLTRTGFAEQAGHLAVTASGLAASARALHATAESHLDAGRSLLDLLRRPDRTAAAPAPPRATAENLLGLADDSARAAESAVTAHAEFSGRAAELAESARSAAAVLRLLPGLRARGAESHAEALHADVADAATRAGEFADTADRLTTVSRRLLTAARLVRQHTTEVARLLGEDAAPGGRPRAPHGGPDPARDATADDTAQTPAQSPAQAPAQDAARRAAALLRAGEALSAALGPLHDAARRLRNAAADAVDDAARLPGDSAGFPPRALDLPPVRSDKARLDRAYHTMVPTTAMHAEHLSAPDVFAHLVDRLGRAGFLQRDQDGEALPDDLYRAVRANFSGEALRDQFHALLGTGVTGWYALPRGGGALGARYLRVRVSAARLGDALWNRLRPEVKIMYRSESSRQWQDAVVRALRRHASLSGRVNGGTSGIHGGLSADGSVDREESTSRATLNKDIRIFRADLKEPVQEFAHHIDFEVRVDAYATLPAFAQAPRDLAAAIRDRVASWLPENNLLGSAVQAVRRYTDPWLPLERMTSLWADHTPGGALFHSRFPVRRQLVQVLVPQSFTTPGDSPTALPGWTRGVQEPADLRWAPPRAAPPAHTAVDATQDMYSWGGPVLYAVRTWAKAAALRSATEPPLRTRDDIENLLRAGSLRPGSVAEVAYENAVGYNSLRPRLAELLRGSYVVDVGGVPVRVRLALTGHQEHTPSARNMKVRTYNPTTTAPENENSRRFGWGIGAGADVVAVPRHGLHEILNLPAKRELTEELKNAYEIGDTDESNRLVDNVPYTAFLFDTVLQMEPVHHPRRALHVTVFGGLLASVPHRSDADLARRLRDLTSGGPQQPSGPLLPHTEGAFAPGDDTPPPGGPPGHGPERAALREAWGRELAGRSNPRERAAQLGAETDSALQAWELWESATRADDRTAGPGALDRATREMVAWSLVPGPRQHQRYAAFERTWRQRHTTDGASPEPAEPSTAPPRDPETAAPPQDTAPQRSPGTGTGVEGARSRAEAHRHGAVEADAETARARWQAARLAHDSADERRRALAAAGRRAEHGAVPEGSVIALRDAYDAGVALRQAEDEMRAWGLPVPAQTRPTPLTPLTPLTSLTSPGQGSAPAHDGPTTTGTGPTTTGTGPVGPTTTAPGDDHPHRAGQDAAARDEARPVQEPHGMLPPPADDVTAPATASAARPAEPLPGTYRSALPPSRVEFAPGETGLDDRARAHLEQTARTLAYTLATWRAQGASVLPPVTVTATGDPALGARRGVTVREHLTLALTRHLRRIKAPGVLFSVLASTGSRDEAADGDGQVTVALNEAVVLAFPDPAGMEAGRRTYPMRTPADAPALRAVLANAGQRERLARIDALPPEQRRWLAADPVTVRALGAALTPEDFTAVAAKLMVDVPAGTESPAAARYELEQIAGRMLVHPGIATEMLLRGTRMVVIPRHGSSDRLGFSAQRWAGQRMQPRDFAHSAHPPVAMIAEENITGVLDGAGRVSFPDGVSSAVHEIAHLLHYMLTPDEQDSVREAYQGLQRADHAESAAAGRVVQLTSRWPNGPLFAVHDAANRRVSVVNYAAKNEYEFFAHLASAWMGTNLGTDFLTGLELNNGRLWVEEYVPSLVPLLTTYLGRGHRRSHAFTANPVDSELALAHLTDFTALVEGAGTDGRGTAGDTATRGDTAPDTAAGTVTGTETGTETGTVTGTETGTTGAAGDGAPLPGAGAVESPASGGGGLRPAQRETYRAALGEWAVEYAPGQVQLDGSLREFLDEAARPLALALANWRGQGANVLPRIVLEVTGDPALADARRQAVAQHLARSVDFHLRQLGLSLTGSLSVSGPPGPADAGEQVVIRLDEDAAVRAALGDRAGMESRRLTYPMRIPADVPALRAELLAADQDRRLALLADLPHARRRWLAADTGTVDALRWALPEADFPAVAARLLVDVPDGVEAPVTARRELERITARMLPDPDVASRLLTCGTRLVVLPRAHHLLPLDHAYQRWSGEAKPKYPFATGEGHPPVAMIAEENLTGVLGAHGWANWGDGLSNAVHEIAHLVHRLFGPEARKDVRDAYEALLAADAAEIAASAEPVQPASRWPNGPRHAVRDVANHQVTDGNYAATNEFEFFATLVTAWLGTNSGVDHLTGLPLNNGNAWVAAHFEKLVPTLTAFFGPGHATGQEFGVMPVEDDRVYGYLGAFTAQVDGVPHHPAERVPGDVADTGTDLHAGAWTAWRAAHERVEAAFRALEGLRAEGESPSRPRPSEAWLDAVRAWDRANDDLHAAQGRVAALSYNPHGLRRAYEAFRTKLDEARNGPEQRDTALDRWTRWQAARAEREASRAEVRGVNARLTALAGAEPGVRLSAEAWAAVRRRDAADRQLNLTDQRLRALGLDPRLLAEQSDRFRNAAPGVVTTALDHHYAYLLARLLLADPVPGPDVRRVLEMYRAAGDVSPAGVRNAFWDWSGRALRDTADRAVDSGRMPAEVREALRELTDSAPAADDRTGAEAAAVTGPAEQAHHRDTASASPPAGTGPSLVRRLLDGAAGNAPDRARAAAEAAEWERWQNATRDLREALDTLKALEDTGAAASRAEPAEAARRAARHAVLVAEDARDTAAADLAARGHDPRHLAAELARITRNLEPHRNGIRAGTRPLPTPTPNPTSNPTPTPTSTSNPAPTVTPAPAPGQPQPSTAGTSVAGAPMPPGTYRSGFDPVGITFRGAGTGLDDAARDTLHDAAWSLAYALANWRAQGADVLPAVVVRITGDPVPAAARARTVTQYLSATVSGALRQMQAGPMRVDVEARFPRRTDASGTGVSDAVVHLDEFPARQAALADPQGMEARRRTYPVRMPDDPDAVRRQLPGLARTDRLTYLAGLAPEQRRWVAADPATIEALQAALAAPEFAEVAAALMVDVPAAAEGPLAARYEMEQVVARMLPNPSVAAELLRRGTRLVVIPRIDRDVARDHSPALWGEGALEQAFAVPRHPPVVMLNEELVVGGRNRDGQVLFPDGHGTTVHEMAHLVHFVLAPHQRAQITAAFDSALKADRRRINPLWRAWELPSHWPNGPRFAVTGPGRTAGDHNYSAKNEFEFFATLVSAWMGTNIGVDAYTGLRLSNGNRWVAERFPRLVNLLTSLFGPGHRGGHEVTANPVDTVELQYEHLRDFTAQLDLADAWRLALTDHVDPRDADGRRRIWAAWEAYDSAQRSLAAARSALDAFHRMSSGSAGAPPPDWSRAATALGEATDRVDQADRDLRALGFDPYRLGEEHDDLVRSAARHGAAEWRPSGPLGDRAVFEAAVGEARREQASDAAVRRWQAAQADLAAARAVMDALADAPADAAHRQGWAAAAQTWSDALDAVDAAATELRALGTDPDDLVAETAPRGEEPPGTPADPGTAAAPAVPAPGRASARMSMADALGARLRAATGLGSGAEDPPEPGTARADAEATVAAWVRWQQARISLNRALIALRALEQTADARPAAVLEAADRAVTRAEWDVDSAAWELQERGYDRRHLATELADLLRGGLRVELP
ncbi:hypothetical protein [Streptomyces ziwulingensis]|uniref:Outer membrane channel protein CpnT-like N-terminal domain-containing protein n=1 Tax=Streptomyces ziwulingensis TaxID=1045501 RepID=A0ABP9BGK0_9ACTN